MEKEKCEALSNQLFEYLSKQEDSAEENKYHFYMLHKALGNFDIASNLVSILAEEEQVLFWRLLTLFFIMTSFKEPSSKFVFLYTLEIG